MRKWTIWKWVVTLVALILTVYSSTTTARSTTGKYPSHGVLDTIVVSVESGWNIVSLPLDVVDKRVASVYPTTISGAFSYEGGYVEVDSLVPGVGYWLKFDSAQTIPIIGNRFPEFMTTLRRGWNLIGSSSDPLKTDRFDVDPCTATILSAVYAYLPGNGYTMVDTIPPGEGAWVKLDVEGLLYEKKWIKVTDLPISSLASHPMEPNILVAAISSDASEGTLGAIVKSTDFGSTWDTLVSNVDAGYGNILFDPTDPNVIYAGLGGVNTCNPGVLKSIDGGNTWSRADSGLVENLNCFSWAFVQSIDPNNPNVLYATSGGVNWPSGTYKSTNGGTYWFQLPIPQTANCSLTNGLESNPIRLGIDPKNSDVIYAATELDTILYWSTDGGKSWDIRHCFYQAGWINSIHVDPTDSNKIYIGAKGVYRSTDRGGSWSTMNDGLSNIEYGVAVLPTSNPNVLYSQISCFFRSSNGNMNWEEVECDPMIKIFEALDETGKWIYVSNPQGVYKLKICTVPKN